MSLNHALHWRYAPKRMTGQRVSDEQLNAILKAAQYAPTSMGLQPFNLYLIDRKDLIEAIKPIAYHQPQVSEASHLLLFAAYNHLSAEHIDTYLENISETRGVTMQSLSAFRDSMMRFANSSSTEQIRHWATNQAYISLGFALAEAALINVDVTPMEGFDANAMDALLELQKQGLYSVALLAIGFRDEANDFLAAEKKVRRPLDKLVTRLTGSATTPVRQS